MKKYKLFLFVILPISLIFAYGYYYVSSHTFIKLSIHTSHSTHLSIHWSESDEVITQENVLSLPSKSIAIYPNKKSYIFAMPKSFSLENMTAFIINPQDRIDLITIFNQVHIMFKGGSVFNFDVERVFKNDFRFLEDTVAYEKRANGKPHPYRIKAMKEFGFLTMKESTIQSIKNKIAEQD